MQIALNGTYGRGKFVLVSEIDYPKLKDKNMCVLKSGYVMFHEPSLQQPVYLHRWIFGLKKGDKTLIDHISRDRLDCRRENLRFASYSENQCNKLKHMRNTSSEFKGVSLAKNGKWNASIVFEKKQYSLGTFNTEIEAAIAYNVRAKELHKSFAVLNIIPDNTEGKSIP